MGTKAYIIGFFVGLAVFLIFDFLWLAVLARNIYQKNLGELKAKKPFLPAALAFYAFFIAGLLYLVIAPFSFLSPESVIFRGAVFGFMCYMTYELTNWAVIKSWPHTLVIIDILWGTFLTACVTGSILSVLQMFKLINLAL